MGKTATGSTQERAWINFATKFNSEKDGAFVLELEYVAVSTEKKSSAWHSDVVKSYHEQSLFQFVEN